MTIRRAIVTVVVLVLVALAGCVGAFGGSSLSDERLDADAEYEWDSDADVHVTVEVGQFYAVYRLDGETTYDLSRSGYYQDRAIDIEAVRFRYPNGTELTGSQLDIAQSRSTTTIEVPDGNGSLAFSASAGAKQVVVPGLVEGSYTVALPPGHRVGNFILSNVRPSYDENHDEPERQVLHWSEHDGDISVQFYLERDHYLFWGIILGGLAVAGGGTLYYRRQIHRLAMRRHELANDLIDEPDR